MAKFTKNNNANPRGRPKGSKDWRSTFTVDMLMKQENTKKIPLLIKRAFEHALNEKARIAYPYFKLIMDFYFVKPTQSIDVSTEEGKNLSAISDSIIKDFMLVKQGKAKVVKSE